MAPGLTCHRVVDRHVRDAEFLGELSQCRAIGVKSAQFPDIVTGELGIPVTFTFGPFAACNLSPGPRPVVMHRAKPARSIGAITPLDCALRGQPLLPPHRSIVWTKCRNGTVPSK